MAGLGLAAGVATVAAPIALSMIKSRSVEPAKSLANAGVLLEMGKRAAFGYGIGYAAGMVVDKTPLKRPVNKALKFVGMK